MLLKKWRFTSFCKIYGHLIVSSKTYIGNCVYFAFHPPRSFLIFVHALPRKPLIDNFSIIFDVSLTETSECSEVSEICRDRACPVRSRVAETPKALRLASTLAVRFSTNRDALGEMVQQESAVRPVCGAVRQHHSTQSGIIFNESTQIGHGSTQYIYESTQRQLRCLFSLYCMDISELRNFLTTKTTREYHEISHFSHMIHASPRSQKPKKPA